MNAERIESCFDRCAEGHAARPAVTCSGRTLDYRSLADGARALAGQLRGDDPAEGSRVAVVLPNGAEFVQAVLASWYARKVVVPVSSAYARDSVRRLVDTLGIDAMITTCEGRDKFSGLTRTLVATDGEQWTVFSSVGPTTPQMSLNDLFPFGEKRDKAPGSAEHAVMFLTSGTTGQPKVVALTHRNILTNMDAAKHLIPLSHDDRSYVCVALCHSYGFTLQMLGTICNGGELYVGSPRKTGVELTQELISSKCTSVFAVPSGFRLMIDGARRCLAHGQSYHVQTVVNGASSMTPDVLEGLREVFPKAGIHLTYGLSEASPLVTHLPPQWLDKKGCSIGRAVPGVDLKLVNSDGHLVDRAGDIGEVAIRGPSVIDRYLAAAAVNAKAFLDGYLRTGDLAAMDADRCLFFRGRLKDLINRGGQKVYPEDVEAVLLGHAAVAQAAVVACPHSTCGEVPYTFVVPSRAGGCEVKDLRQWCQKSLSPHQIPMGFEFVESLPRTGTGKVRKNELVAMLALRAGNYKES